MGTLTVVVVVVAIVILVMLPLAVRIVRQYEGARRIPHP